MASLVAKTGVAFSLPTLMYDYAAFFLVALGSMAVGLFLFDTSLGGLLTFSWVICLKKSEMAVKVSCMLPNY